MFQAANSFSNSSDHSPFRFDSDKGKKVKGSETKFCNVPNGVPGIETRMPLLMSKGVFEERIDIQKFVSITSTNPSKIYGLYPRKGTIAPGSDADIVIWNTKNKFNLFAKWSALSDSSSLLRIEIHKSIPISYNYPFITYLYRMLCV